MRRDRAITAVMTRRVALSATSIFVPFSLGLCRGDVTPDLAVAVGTDAHTTSLARATLVVLVLLLAHPPLPPPHPLAGATRPPRPLTRRRLAARRRARGAGRPHGAGPRRGQQPHRVRRHPPGARARGGRATASSRPALGSIRARARGRPPARAASFLPAPPRRPRSLAPDALSSPALPARPLRSTLDETPRETATVARETPTPPPLEPNPHTAPRRGLRFFFLCWDAPATGRREEPEDAQRRLRRPPRRYGGGPRGRRGDRLEGKPSRRERRSIASRSRRRRASLASSRAAVDGRASSSRFDRSRALWGGERVVR